jgi:hypothetical protein
LSGNASLSKDLLLVIFFIVAVPVVVTGLTAAIQYSKVFAPESPPSAGARCASAVLVIAAVTMVFAAYFAAPSLGVGQQ